MTKFIPGGPERYAHQKQGLINMIKNRGVHALLFSPGTGKTAVTLDYASLLAMKSPTGEARVLVIAPLAAVDTWVSQSEEYVHPDVSFWAEALGGSIKQRGETLAIRGKNPFPRSTVKPYKREAPRAAQNRRSHALAVRGGHNHADAGPNALPTPRLVLCAVNLDAFSSRSPVNKGSSKLLSDFMVDAVKRFAPDLIVVDECHPAGTMVETPFGRVPIETLSEGDEVLSLDESGVIVTKVTHTFSRETDEPLWTLGETQATPEHPVWTTSGFIPISEVESGDQIMRIVRQEFHIAALKETQILFDVVLEEVDVDRESETERTAVRTDDRDEFPTGGSRETERTLVGTVEPFLRSRGQEKSVRSESSGRVSRPASEGRQRYRTDYSAETTFRSTRLENRTHRGNRFSGTLRRLTKSLQSGCRKFVSKGSGGSRWGISQSLKETGSRQAQGFIPTENGLDRVSLHEPSGDGKSGNNRRVYNIETEAGTYFAEGILVHNSHRIKSASSNVSRTMARLSKICRRRVILTGTVLPHSPLDIYGQWRFLEPEAFGTKMADGSTRPASFGTFRNRFAKMGGWMGKEVTGFKNLDEMQDVMALNSTVAKKEDVLDLPATTDVIVPVHLSPAEKQAYDDMKKALATMLAGGSLASVPNRLTQIMRLRQITSGFIKDDAGVVQEIGQSKVKVIKSIVQDTLAGETRIVIFAHFRHELDQLEKTLTKKGTEVVKITGATSSEDRTLIRKKFGSDDPQRIVMLAQIKTMSLAVNELVTASHAIFASLSQQRDDFVQSRDRLDRIGQTRPVTFWYALSPKSIDEVIMKAHRDRTSLEDAMLKHISE